MQGKYVGIQYEDGEKRNWLAFHIWIVKMKAGLLLSNAGKCEYLLSPVGSEHVAAKQFSVASNNEPWTLSQ